MLAEKQQLIQRMIDGYQLCPAGIERQSMLRKVSEVWIEGARELPLRQYTLSLVAQLDNQTTQLALGKADALPSEVQEMRQALAGLVILEKEDRTRELVGKIIDAVIAWAINNECERQAILEPILHQISLGELRGLCRWYDL